MNSETDLQSLKYSQLMTDIGANKTLRYITPWEQLAKTSYTERAWPMGGGASPL